MVTAPTNNSPRASAVSFGTGVCVLAHPNTLASAIRPVAERAGRREEPIALGRGCRAGNHAPRVGLGRAAGRIASTSAHARDASRWDRGRAHQQARRRGLGRRRRRDGRARVERRYRRLSRRLLRHGPRLRGRTRRGRNGGLGRHASDVLRSRRSPVWGADARGVHRGAGIARRSPWRLLGHGPRFGRGVALGRFRPLAGVASRFGRPLVDEHVLDHIRTTRTATRARCRRAGGWSVNVARHCGCNRYLGGSAPLQPGTPSGWLHGRRLAGR